MKSKPTGIQVSIDERDAISIINALQQSTSPMRNTLEESGAIALLDLLRSNFQSSVKGIHYTD